MTRGIGFKALVFDNRPGVDLTMGADPPGIQDLCHPCVLESLSEDA